MFYQLTKAFSDEGGVDTRRLAGSYNRSDTLLSSSGTTRSSTSAISMSNNDHPNSRGSCSEFDGYGRGSTPVTGPPHLLAEPLLHLNAGKYDHLSRSAPSLLHDQMRHALDHTMFMKVAPGPAGLASRQQQPQQQQQQGHTLPFVDEGNFDLAFLLQLEALQQQQQLPRQGSLPRPGAASSNGHWMPAADAQNRQQQHVGLGMQQQHTPLGMQQQQQRETWWPGLLPAEQQMPQEDNSYNLRGTTSMSRVPSTPMMVTAADFLASQGGQPAMMQQMHMQAKAQALPPRVLRKADFVIVNEDTAVKNAAGAITKVLARVCSQGLSCPVFTERRTEQVAGVISVAVKAIAVARDYVANEGNNYHVAFLPYLRHQAGQNPGSRWQQERLEEQTWLNPAPLLTKSAENVDVNPSDMTLSDEHAEIAFDVFKVPGHLLPAANAIQPVKVTASSRVSVVASVIASTVADRGSVMLMSAGGRATHIAIMAITSARARLRAGLGVKGIADDLMVVPSFMTVDTTSTLGWASIFLRFDIVKAPPALLGTGGALLPALAMDGMGLPIPLSYGDSLSGVMAPLVQQLPVSFYQQQLLMANCHLLNAGLSNGGR